MLKHTTCLQGMHLVGEVMLVSGESGYATTASARVHVPHLTVLAMVLQGMHVEGEVMLAPGESGYATTYATTASVLANTAAVNGVRSSFSLSDDTQGVPSLPRPRTWLPAAGATPEALTAHLGLSGIRCDLRRLYICCKLT